MKPLISLSFVFCTLLFSFACNKPDGEQANSSKSKQPVFPVELAPIEERDLEFVIQAVGSVEPYEMVQITSRVPGAVDKANFLEGQHVKTGELIAEIDIKRYQVSVDAAQAALLRANASKTEAQSTLERREQAQKNSPGLISTEELELYKSKYSAAIADQLSAKAALEQAKLNRQDAYVRAPFEGILQSRTVQTGQYVQTGHILTTLLRKNPVLVRFKVADNEATHIKTGMKILFNVGNNLPPLSGEIFFVASSADMVSRMVLVSAKIDNPDSLEIPLGSFANVTVLVGKIPHALVIPQLAIRPTERGFLAFVVENNDDKTVARERVLQLGLRTTDGLVQVQKGLNLNERLVIRGAEALKEGSLVSLKTTTPPAVELKVTP
ncbi:MAG: efflux RND transporter periplasmic adaptor subunit [Proteobacteria bacterium]|nr:efflux RND transporter periplasmic adaptor subunit [Cystobacterineae bacterium]MCL2258433.1 efflux RND transporter periplasmic adaptor subunit [Cystobacterineae bacterium]MCL2315226.1 efflux RND transporter periplasmic adaptor subunit [Pseudomonadota bacterium]